MYLRLLTQCPFSFTSRRWNYRSIFFFCVFNHFFTSSVPAGLHSERRNRHGDLCRVPASKLSAEAGGVAAGEGCLLLPHPPGLPHTRTPRYTAQVGVKYTPAQTGLQSTLSLILLLPIELARGGCAKVSLYLYYTTACTFTWLSGDVLNLLRLHYVTEYILRHVFVTS